MSQANLAPYTGDDIAAILNCLDYQSCEHPDRDLLVINLCVAVEQFGYGFGFTAYMVYMLLVAGGAELAALIALYSDGSIRPRISAISVVCRAAVSAIAFSK